MAGFVRSYGYYRNEAIKLRLAIEFEEVVGIVISSKAIELCNKNPSKSKRTHYIHSDFYHHDFMDRKFDFISATGFSPFNSSNFQRVDRTMQRL